MLGPDCIRGQLSHQPLEPAALSLQDLYLLPSRVSNTATVALLPASMNAVLRLRRFFTVASRRTPLQDDAGLLLLTQRALQVAHLDELLDFRSRELDPPPATTRMPEPADGT